MKTIGLIGGLTWLSTAEYYKLLNQSVNEKLGGVSSAKIVLHSVNFEEIKQLTEAGNWDGILAIISKAAKQLEQAGADCLLIGANTMHKIADQIQAAISIPVFHIAVATAAVVKAREINKVALLGTQYVMLQDFYKNKLIEQGLEVIIPNTDAISFINQAIYTEMGKGLFLPETKERFIQIIEDLAKEGAQGAILGCTEIPILIQQEDVSIPIFDTTRIHVNTAIEFALK